MTADLENDNRGMPVEGKSVISFQIDKFSLKEFEQAVKSADWLEEIHPDNKRSERIRRAMNAVRITLRTSPTALEKKVSDAAKELSEMIETIDGRTLRRRLDALESMLLLLAALKEMEKGRHGGDIEEGFALTLQNLVTVLDESNIDEIRKEASKTLHGVEAVLAVARR